MTGHLVLVVNAGSSSVKYQLLDTGDGRRLGHGLIERIGSERPSAWHAGPSGRVDGPVTCPDHRTAIALALAAFHEHGPGLDPSELAAVGHRVVHGGSRFQTPHVVTPEVLAAIEELIPLAPLHNPANIEGIRAARDAFPTVPQVAVFDTAFHQTLEPRAYTYAVPRSWREELHVRRYGFHGTSHAYVSHRLADLMDRPLGSVNSVVLHLGNGASAAAVRGGRCIDTSMGVTPLEGLVMGTRSGDVDPGLAAFMLRHGLSVEEYDTALNSESGLRGLTGMSDFREVVAARAAGDDAAALAVDVAGYRLAKYVGGYAVALGRLDALAFTAGIGEHSATLRAEVGHWLRPLGVVLDRAANDASMPAERRISADASPVQVWVVPTDEELQIAREAVRLLHAGSGSADPV